MIAGPLAVIPCDLEMIAYPHTVLVKSLAESSIRQLGSGLGEGQYTQPEATITVFEGARARVQSKRRAQGVKA